MAKVVLCLRTYLCSPACTTAMYKYIGTRSDCLLLQSLRDCKWWHWHLPRQFSFESICSIRLLLSMRCFLSISLNLTIFNPFGRCMSSLQYGTLLQLIDCSALRSIPITGASSLLWLLLTSHSSLLLGFILCETSPLKVRTLSPHISATFTLFLQMW